MIFQTKSIYGVLAACVLSACGGTTIQNPPVILPGIDPGNTPGGGASPLPTSFASAAEVQEDRDFINGGFNLDETAALAGVRNGNATYHGTWATGLAVGGQPEITSLIGDIRMEIDVGGGTYPVSGAITNLNTVDGNTGLEQLTGSLTIDGEIGGFSKEFSETGFDGTVTGFFGGDAARSVTIDATVTGEMRNRSGFGNNGSTVTGRTSGSAEFADGIGGIDITTGQFRADRNNN